MLQKIKKYNLSIFVSLFVFASQRTIANPLQKQMNVISHVGTGVKILENLGITGCISMSNNRELATAFILSTQHVNQLVKENGSNLFVSNTLSVTPWNLFVRDKTPITDICNLNKIQQGQKIAHTNAPLTYIFDDILDYNNNTNKEQQIRDFLLEQSIFRQISRLVTLNTQICSEDITKKKYTQFYFKTGSFVESGIFSSTATNGKDKIIDFKYDPFQLTKTEMPEASCIVTGWNFHYVNQFNTFTIGSKLLLTPHLLTFALPKKRHFFEGGKIVPLYLIINSKYFSFGFATLFGVNWKDKFGEKAKSELSKKDLDDDDKALNYKYKLKSNIPFFFKIGNDKIQIYFESMLCKMDEIKTLLDITMSPNKIHTFELTCKYNYKFAKDGDGKKGEDDYTNHYLKIAISYSIKIGNIEFKITISTPEFFKNELDNLTWKPWSVEEDIYVTEGIDEGKYLRPEISLKVKYVKPTIANFTKGKINLEQLQQMSMSAA